MRRKLVFVEERRLDPKDQSVRPEIHPDPKVAAIGSQFSAHFYIDTGSDSNYSTIQSAQVNFFKEALKDTPTGWHIVAVAHMWVQMDYSVSPAAPQSGFAVPAQSLLNIFDAYNARSVEYTDCKGTVEFCVGGHCHLDLDRITAGGIPVIITETDSYNIRSGLSCTAGSTTENAINAIVADYNNKKINVIRIGRGNSRTISF